MLTFRKKIELKSKLVLLSLLCPGLLFYLAFMILPMIDTLNISITNWNGISPDYSYVWLKNYKNLLSDKLFWNAMANTLFWVVSQLIIIVMPTLLLALAITKTPRIMNIFRTGFYMPAIVSFSVAATIWAKIYDPTIGPINAIFKVIGLDSWAKNWLGDPVFVLPVLVIASSWVQYGTYLVLFIAGLQNVDIQLYEAADLDGANSLKKFWHITIPSLSNTMNTVISLVIIGAFKGFSMVWVTTQGGPLYKSDLMATYIYREAFTSYKVGLGAAGGILLALVIVAITVMFNMIRDRRNAA